MGKSLRLNLQQRTIIISGEITDGLAIEFGLAIGRLNQKSVSKEIKLIIDCRDGRAGAGLIMYDMIKFSNAPIVGIVCGKSHTIASFVLQACKKRYALPHAEIWPRHLSVAKEISTSISINELDENTDSVLRLIRGQQKTINEIYRQSTGKPLHAIRVVLKADRPMSTKEAREFGLINDIISEYKDIL